ncbi:MAG: hypothetical protein WAK55_28945 [Xanthobacteraceae bacterium]
MNVTLDFVRINLRYDAFARTLLHTEVIDPSLDATAGDKRYLKHAVIRRRLIVEFTASRLAAAP